MTHPPAWGLVATGTLLTALSSMGLAFSVHLAAKIVYALLLVAGLAAIVSGYRRRKFGQPIRRP